MQRRHTNQLNSLIYIKGVSKYAISMRFLLEFLCQLFHLVVVLLNGSLGVGLCRQIRRALQAVAIIADRANKILQASSLLWLFHLISLILRLGAVDQGL